MSQLSLLEATPSDAPPHGAGCYEHYGPWPGGHNGYYSHHVVWRTCLAWEFRDWLRARKGAA